MVHCGDKILTTEEINADVDKIIGYDYREDVRFLDMLINDQETIVKCFEDKKASEGLTVDEGYTYEKEVGLLIILKDYKNIKNGDEDRSTCCNTDDPNYGKFVAC